MGVSKAKQAEVSLRRSAALKLRRDGKHLAEIAEELGYPSIGHASVDIGRALEAAAAEQRQDAILLRELELQRLDELRDAALTVLRRRHVLVSGGKVVRDFEVTENGEIIGDIAPLEDDGPALAAIDRLVRIGESRRKLLGLDSPLKVEASGIVRYVVDGVNMGELT